MGLFQKCIDRIFYIKCFISIDRISKGVAIKTF